MAESSVPDGFSASLQVAAGATVDNQLAVMLKDMLGQINIDVTIEPLKASATYAPGERAGWKVKLNNHDDLTVRTRKGYRAPKK